MINNAKFEFTNGETETKPPQHKTKCKYIKEAKELIESIDFQHLPIGSPLQWFLSSILCVIFIFYIFASFIHFFFHGKYIISMSVYSLPPMNEQENKKKKNKKKLMKLNSIIECKNMNERSYSFWAWK